LAISVRVKGSVMSKVNRQPPTEEPDPKRAVGFAATVVLPGESREKFLELAYDLCLQYGPQGSAEYDAIQTMANAIWRKRHLEIFQRAFEARMLWGYLFKYPGDPAGLEQFNRDRREIIQGRLKKLQRRLDKHENEEEVTEDQITEERARVLAARGISVKAAPQAEATEILSRREKDAMLTEAFAKLEALCEPIFGREICQDVRDLAEKDLMPRKLAEFGELLTPETYAAELRMIELLDRTIERSYDRLMKLQTTRAKSLRVNPLQPDWIARKR
jgi:hypothetical protein